MAGRKAVIRVPRFCETAKPVTRVLVGNSSWKKDGNTAL
jgi:ribosomal protein S16